MNVLFLDYDGVVNTLMWDDAGKHCRFNHSRDNKVNNFQAVQWVSKFCREYGYDIVVTSTWRFEDNYKDCLINGGLWDGIQILGRTPYVSNGNRGDEIQKYLDEHQEVENFLIFDDDSDMGVLSDHLIKTNFVFGFSMYNYESAVELHNYLVDKHNTVKSEVAITNLKWLGVNAVELSDYVVSKCYEDDCPISNITLQNILYIIQEYFLSCGMIAFYDDFEAWNFGAVIPNSYYRYCGFGAMPITHSYVDKLDIQDKYKNYIDLIVKTYRNYEPHDLMKMMTFDGGAWDYVYDNGSGNKRCIPIKLIQKDAITNGLMQ